MILREIRSDSIMCLPRVTFCDKDRILDAVCFTCICQCFADMFTLLETQLRGSSELDQFHMTSKAQIVRSSSLCPFFPIYMHVCSTHILSPSCKYHRLERNLFCFWKNIKTLQHIYTNSIYI